jgi:L-ascorbate metabolism protein UlaG (beta-lactamase superfamily)
VALLLAALPITACAASAPQTAFPADTIPTSAGDLVLTFVGHGTVMFQVDGTVIQIDPVSREADYSAMPAADVVLVTHDHGDHLDPDAIAAVRTPGTRVFVSRSCAGRVEGATVLENGETRTVDGIRIEAVPAYNLVHMRSNGAPYHVKGDGNGYVLTIGDTRVYVAGDTENTPEMKALQDVDIAFLPMNLPYTMTPAMVADAARAMQPRILYPYHYGETDPQELVRLLQGERGITVRIRPMR